MKKPFSLSYQNQSNKYKTCPQSAQTHLLRIELNSEKLGNSEKLQNTQKFITTSIICFKLIFSYFAYSILFVVFHHFFL